MKRDCLRLKLLRSRSLTSLSALQNFSSTTPFDPKTLLVSTRWLLKDDEFAGFDRSTLYLLQATTMDPIELPLEILEHIFFFVKSTQPTLHAATLVSRSWYSAAIKYLYHSPYITGKNFDLFIRSVCPSVNAHVRHNGLAELVRMLDMSRLVHEASKSLTARLLSRVKGQLEIFIAPQTSFA